MFFEKLVSGEWIGIMCLIEVYCGLDFGMLKCCVEF